MAFTTLIVESIFLGCFTWAWIVALLFRVGALTPSHLSSALDLAKDHTASIAFAGLLLAYPSWHFAPRDSCLLFCNLRMEEGASRGLCATSRARVGTCRSTFTIHDTIE